ncbi:hypothetical protein FAES_1431 [Fibrella aestuarina BUZ 2]|uniref:Uncharacterized protein n=1 Tax=Fibrella aestuarina BUZ 2 TaxID=1166018 RepID=I0K5N8_9BACT|nr:DUF6044 family protein [Fibrella aestuarina]CCG99441.1 hypothetical protein FAES_1431 [Fibrella aestuarina BUZ 2]
MPHRSAPRSFWIARDKPYLWVALGLLVLYLLPYVWLGEGAYLTIHDNLDSDFLYLRLLAHSGKAITLDSAARLPIVMNGLPRAVLRSGLNLEVLTYALLPPYGAWLVNFGLIHAIGFMGMYALLRRYVLPDPPQAPIRVGVALLFALVPCYTVHGASVTGQPLLLFAFLNLLNRRASWRDWLIIALFPFYSFLVWSGLFAGLLLAGLGALVMARRRAIVWPFVGALVMLASLYIASEWQLLYAFVTKTYISHRTEYDYARLMPITLWASLKATFYLFIQTQYHSGAFYTPLILLGSLWVIGADWWRRRQAVAEGPRLTGQPRVILPLLGLIGLICLCHGFYRFPATWAGAGNLLQALQCDRFYFMLPLLWLLLLALSLRQFTPTSWWVRGLLLGQLAVMGLANIEWRINVAKMAGVDNEATYPAYRAFFAERQFTQISNYTGLAPANYRVVSVGIPPAVALYNGLYTLDSYQNNYPLPYKHLFRRVIAAELAKSPTLRTYFDYYANRCYAFSAELGLSENDVMVSKYEHQALQHLQLNTDVLRQLGCRYVLAGLPIRNAAAQHLRLERIFSDSESYWKVYLYRLHGAGS